MAPEEVTSAALALLETVPVMTLATSDGYRPWAAAVYFALDDGGLVFFSSAAARHSREAARNPRAAATIHPEAASWREIRGLQTEGSVAPVADDDTGARLAYFRKFPFAEGLLDATTATGSTLSSARLYRFRPARLWYVDQRLGFGHRVELLLQERRLVVRSLGA